MCTSRAQPPPSGCFAPRRIERQQRLAAVLAQQSAMGLSKAAGTLDMYLEMRQGRGRGRGERRGSQEWRGLG